MSEKMNQLEMNLNSTRRQMISKGLITFGGLAVGTALLTDTIPAEGKESTASAIHANTVTLHMPNSAANIVFDLRKIKMTSQQRTTVVKLFSKNPVPAISEGEHTPGEDGPANKYLTKDEFQSIRELGVRLGTSGVVALTVCDFCLHCVKLDAKADLGQPA